MACNFTVAVMIIFSKILQVITLEECILHIYKTVQKYIILIGVYIDQFNINYKF